MSEKKIIDHTNKKWLWGCLDTEEEVVEVCEYLQKNNLQIEIIGNFEGGENGSGQRVMLEGIDLSDNGFRFSGNNLLVHVRYFRKLKEISETDDFDQWLSKYVFFNTVKKYILEKDQFGMTPDRLNQLIESYNAG